MGKIQKTAPMGGWGRTLEGMPRRKKPPGPRLVECLGEVVTYVDPLMPEMFVRLERNERAVRVYLAEATWKAIRPNVVPWLSKPEVRSYHQDMLVQFQEMAPGEVRRYALAGTEYNRAAAWAGVRRRLREVQ